MLTTLLIFPAPPEIQPLMRRPPRPLVQEQNAGYRADLERAPEPVPIKSKDDARVLATVVDKVREAGAADVVPAV